MSPLRSRQLIDLEEQGLSYSILAAQSRILRLLGDGAAGREVAAEICRIAAGRFAGVGCAILTLDASGQRAELLAEAAVPGAFSAALGGLTLAAARAVFRPLEAGVPDFCAAMTEDLAFAPLHAAARDAGLDSCWSAAVRAAEGDESAAFTGIVCLLQPGRKRPGPRGVKVLELLASLAGLAIERAEKTRDAARERWIDTLTRLPGRQLFERMLRDLIGASDPESSRFALLLIDLDRFREVNERYGSRLGDILLAGFARRLQKALRRGDLAARLQGDCFAVLVRMGADADEATSLAGRFREEGRRAFDFDGQAIALTVSVGVAVYPWDGSQGPVLLANAEVAWRAARAAGGDDFRIYSASLRTDPSTSPERLLATTGEGLESTAAAPESAPKLEELELVWEPFFDVRTRRWVGLTARLRWRRPGGASAAACDLWRAAARAGLAPVLLRWQVRSTLGVFARATRDLPAPVRVVIPIDPAALALEGFVGTVVELMAGERVTPESVALEIPLRAIERDFEKTAPRLAGLAASHVRLELAGIGEGKLPLDALSQLPWAAWKLDPWLTRNARALQATGTLTAGLIAFARKMGVSTSAEEVEDALDLTWLGLHQCDLAQGAALRRPLTAEQLPAFVAEMRKPA